MEIIAEGSVLWNPALYMLACPIALFVTATQEARQFRTLIYCRVCERFTWHTGDGEPWQLGGKRLVLWHCEVCGDTASEEAV